MIRCPGAGCEAQVQDRALCEDCLNYFCVIVDDLDMLWIKAHALLARIGKPAQERVTSKPVHANAPLNLQVLDAVESAYQVVTSWAATVAIREGDEQVQGNTQGERMENALSYLYAYYLTLKGSPLLTNMYNAIYVVRNKLNRLAGTDPEVARVPVPCFKCGMLTLLTRRAGDHIVCLTCSSVWGQAVFHRLMTQATGIGTSTSVDR